MKHPFLTILSIFICGYSSPILADKLPSFLHFEMGGGQSQLQGEVEPLRRQTHLAALAIGTGLTDRAPFYVALLGETYQVQTIPTQGPLGLNQKVKHEGLGVGMRGGFNWSWGRLWGEFTAGRLTTRYSLKKQNRSSVDPIDTIEPYPPEPEQFVDVRHSYLAGGGGFGFNLYRSHEARLDFNITGKRMFPELGWRDDFGYGKVFYYGAQLSMTVYNAIKQRSENL